MTGRQQHYPRLALPGGGELSGYLSHGDSIGTAALVYVHGFASIRTGDKATVLEVMCAHRGWTFAAFDFRGHGSSSGTLLDLRGTTLLEDLEAVRTYLSQAGMTRLFPVGSSMGGWATSWFALRHADVVPAAAFIAPAFEFVRGRWGRLSQDERLAFQRFRRMTVVNYGRDRTEEIDYGLVEQADQFSSEELARSWRTPALIFHSLRDDSVPYQDSLALLQRTTSSAIELRLFTGGDHRQPAPVAAMAEEIGRFFAPMR
jgi:pimeloyl-ACP methyl ester carboxylesterase